MNTPNSKAISFKSLLEIKIVVTAEVDDNIANKGSRIRRQAETSFYIADCDFEKAMKIALNQTGYLDRMFFDSWDRSRSLNPVLVSKEVVEGVRRAQIPVGEPILIPESEFPE